MRPLFGNMGSWAELTDISVNREKIMSGRAKRGLFLYPLPLFAAAVLWGIAAALFTMGVAFAGDVLRVGGDCSYPPFIYKDADGRLKGFDVDIAEEIGRRLNKSVERECVAFDGFIPALLADKYDVIIAALDNTPERARRVDFSVPYYRAPAVFAGLKTLSDALPDKSAPLSAAFLKDKKIGILRASVFERYLQKHYSQPLKLIRYDSMDFALIDLRVGRIDLALMDKPKIEEDFLQRPGNEGYGIIGADITDYALLGGGASVAVRKGNAVLLEQINAAIKDMMADGSYDSLTHKYWSFSVKP